MSAFIEYIPSLSSNEARLKGYHPFSIQESTPQSILDVSHLKGQRQCIQFVLENGDVLQVMHAYDGRSGELHLDYQGVKRMQLQAYSDSRTTVRVGNQYLLRYGSDEPVQPCTFGGTMRIPLKKTNEHTFIMRLGNGIDLTCCHIPFVTATGGEDGTFDWKCHDKEGLSIRREGAALHPEEKAEKIVADFFTIAYNS